MVIDDDLKVLEGVGLLLSSWGHRGFIGATVDEIRRRHEQAGAPTVDVIVADYRLADGMAGTAAVERLTGHLGYRVPVLIVTVDTSPERLREFAASGHVLLHKPLAADALQEAIRRAVDEAAATGADRPLPG